MWTLGGFFYASRFLYALLSERMAYSYCINFSSRCPIYTGSDPECNGLMDLQVFLKAKKLGDNVDI